MPLIALPRTLRVLVFFMLQRTRQVRPSAVPEMLNAKQFDKNARIANANQPWPLASFFVDDVAFFVAKELRFADIANLALTCQDARSALSLSLAPRRAPGYSTADHGCGSQPDVQGPESSGCLTA